jgi:hypothetical protein
MMQIGREAYGLTTVTMPRIVETVDAVREDWSRVRSPSRAERRRRQGHPQNIVLVPMSYEDIRTGTIYAHPLYVAELRQHLAARMEFEAARILALGVSVAGS